MSLNGFIENRGPIQSLANHIPVSFQARIECFVELAERAFFLLIVGNSDPQIIKAFQEDVHKTVGIKESLQFVKVRILRLI